MILATAFDVLAQVGNPTPEPPPGSEKHLQIVRYLIWLAVIGVVALVVIGIPLIVVLVTRRSNRRAQGGPGMGPGYGGPHQPWPGGPGGGGPGV
ncbi:hypothetical protein SAMN04244553_1822 [Nocardia amikacinitolerans]|uniref:Uncharacterized protein n=2 Tax=Nocardia amikacinitolerans TaxID=756689 RepID=A0A285L5A3_9NOCA|nr:hypothetical protein SAMN04244553_1822 [Nocardia amikacinitolerans]